MNILVKYEDYKSYVEIHKSPYLDKKNKYRIWSKSKDFILNGFEEINEEIFNGTETDYNLTKNGDNYLIIFNTKSGNEYRFDIIKEPNTKIYHLAFSLSKSSEFDYEKMTDMNESIEVFSRLVWILKDANLDVEEYCIGATGTKKDKIYEYMMRFVKSWDKRENKHYKLGWALYFKL